VKIPLLTRLVLALTILPLLDLGAIILMSHFTGGWVTFGTVVACGVLGAFLVRREGVAAWQRLQAEMREGVIPEAAMLDGVIILAAGLLLMTPGPLTDAMGLALLLPPVRARVQSLLRYQVQKLLLQGAVNTIQRVTVIRQ
jgi:UPF0716 protein FxsA